MCYDCGEQNYTLFIKGWLVLIYTCVDMHTCECAHTRMGKLDSVLPLPEGIKLTSPPHVYINIWIVGKI